MDGAWAEIVYAACNDLRNHTTCRYYGLDPEGVRRFPRVDDER